MIKIQAFRTLPFPAMILLYLSGLNTMEGMLNKEQWLRFPPKPNDAKIYNRKRKRKGRDSNSGPFDLELTALFTLPRLLF